MRSTQMSVTLALVAASLALVPMHPALASAGAVEEPAWSELAGSHRTRFTTELMTSDGHVAATLSRGSRTWVTWLEDGGTEWSSRLELPVPEREMDDRRWIAVDAEEIAEIWTTEPADGRRDVLTRTIAMDGTVGPTTRIGRVPEAFHDLEVVASGETIAVALERGGLGLKYATRIFTSVQGSWTAHPQHRTLLGSFHVEGDGTIVDARVTDGEVMVVRTAPDGTTEQERVGPRDGQTLRFQSAGVDANEHGYVVRWTELDGADVAYVAAIPRGPGSEEWAVDRIGTWCERGCTTSVEVGAGGVVHVLSASPSAAQPWLMDLTYRTRDSSGWTPPQTLLAGTSVLEQGGPYSFRDELRIDPTGTAVAVVPVAVTGTYRFDAVTFVCPPTLGCTRLGDLEGARAYTASVGPLASTDRTVLVWVDRFQPDDRPRLAMTWIDHTQAVIG